MTMFVYLVTIILFNSRHCGVILSRISRTKNMVHGTTFWFRGGCPNLPSHRIISHGQHIDAVAVSGIYGKIMANMSP